MHARHNCSGNLDGGSFAADRRAASRPAAVISSLAMPTPGEISVPSDCSGSSVAAITCGMPDPFALRRKLTRRECNRSHSDGGHQQRQPPNRSDVMPEDVDRLVGHLGEKQRHEADEDCADTSGNAPAPQRRTGSMTLCENARPALHHGFVLQPGVDSEDNKDGGPRAATWRRSGSRSSRLRLEEILGRSASHSNWCVWRCMTISDQVR